LASSGHVAKHLAAGRPRQPDGVRVECAESVGGELFVGERLVDHGRDEPSDRPQVADANVCRQDGEQRFGVRELQTLAPLDPDEIGVPVIRRRRLVGGGCRGCR
jgi:hypothetical protein